MDTTIKGEILNIDVQVSEKEMKLYGEDGLRQLLNNIIERYFHEEYFDPELTKDLTK